MLRTFLSALIERFHARGLKGKDGSHRPERDSLPLRLESLEDRCLPSATTTVPAFSDVPPLVAIPDVLMAMQPKGNPNIVFVGDSIGFEFRYGTGAAIWSAFLAPVGAANYAMSGQTTQSLLFQLSLGQLSGINPSVVVLDIGGNNLLQGDSPQDTAAGVLADVALIHQNLPQAQVLVLGVLPGKQSPTDPYRLAGAQTDALVSQMLTGDPHATFVNIGWVFLQTDGTISDSVLFDYLHPSALGYLNFTAALWPYIQQALPSITPPSVPAGAASPSSPAPSSHLLLMSA